VADSFDGSNVFAALAGTVFAGHVHHLPSVESTNTLAMEAAHAGAPHGSVWVADEQTSGRGRGGHSWHSTAGDGLYVSVLLRPQMALESALWLSLATGLAVQAAIRATTKLAPDIRWPNDILIGDKKCAGILVESSTTPPHSDSPAMLRFVVIGVGINVNHEEFPPELTALATSLQKETGRSWDRSHLLTSFLRELASQIDLLEAELRGQFTGGNLLTRFTANSGWVSGKRVSVEENGGYTGVTDGLDSRGFLLVAGDDGLRHTVISGGVRSQQDRAMAEQKA